MMYYIALISMAALATQIAYDSTLVQRWKNTLLIPQSVLKRFKMRLLKKPFIYTFFSIPVLLYLRFNIYLRELLDCPYCTGFWLGILMGALYAQPLLITITHAPLTLIGVYLIEKLIRN